ncbi:hypothetical protein [Candidatus Methylobacter oryzae]|uniref:Uncharacterized protein n=1 Tax=Candidatus Methylobacter oryzae TaxID=2497749 RepID=A0ABY3CIC4_9GAMM|nr:hypothetical protein [Candidatus Methylobacter oryzae]TRX01165.1 hypothetical protein EKO24_004355 [Candidatus Methylobacter oryzae]
MSIDFDVVIDSPEHSIDMKSGLETLQGVSETTRYIAETVLTGNIVKKQFHTSKIRTILKQSFKGSYGHIYSLDIYDEKLEKKFRKIGQAIFSEIMTYFINESLYLETRELSEKAQNIIDTLGEKAEGLIKQLRVSSLENVHEISTKFGHDVKLRYRKSRVSQTTLAIFNKSTLQALQAEESSDIFDVRVSITRLNINTGNGRLLLKDTTETVAFGFGIEYKAVTLEAKKKFSENLNHNNGLNSEDWIYLKIEVKPIKLKDGKIVKYIVKGFYND